MLYRISDWNDAIAFETWATSCNIQFEELDEGNYMSKCPQCHDTEYWHDGCCSHCGYEA